MILLSLLAVGASVAIVFPILALIEPQFNVYFEFNSFLNDR